MPLRHEEIYMRIAKLMLVGFGLLSSLLVQAAARGKRKQLRNRRLLYLRIACRN